MGIFDFLRKKKHIDTATNKVSQKSTGQENDTDMLSHAIDVLMKHDTPESRKHVFSVFRRYVEEGKWLFTLGETDEKGTKLYTINERGKEYIPVYTDGRLIEKGKGTVIQTDVNKYLEVLYSTDISGGLVINPGKQNMYFEKDYIPAFLIHDKFPKQDNSGSPQKNWGEGIPVYKESDLMTKGQMLNFAMQVVNDYDLKTSEFMPISYCDNTNAPCNFIMKKDNDLFFIVVYPYAFPDEPKFEDEKIKIVLNLCKKFNAKCLFAPVGLGSCDEERAAASLLLNGDGFYANYTGMEEINIDSTHAKSIQF